jgi:tyrosinase
MVRCRKYHTFAYAYFVQFADACLSFRWWDETQDAGAFSKSAIFDAELGFGGSGSGSANCLTDGPFVNKTVNIGPGFTTAPRCVNRRITDFLSAQTGQSYVDEALSYPDYVTALDGIYSGPHLYGHMALAMMVSPLHLNVMDIKPLPY